MGTQVIIAKDLLLNMDENAHQLEGLLYQHSGLIGVSGISSDEDLMIARHTRALLLKGK